MEDESVVYKTFLSNILCLANIGSITYFCIERRLFGDSNNSIRYLSKKAGSCYLTDKKQNIKSLSNRCSGFFMPDVHQQIRGANNLSLERNILIILI